MGGLHGVVDVHVAPDLLAVAEDLQLVGVFLELVYEVPDDAVSEPGLHHVSVSQRDGSEAVELGVGIYHVFASNFLYSLVQVPYHGR